MIHNVTFALKFFKENGNAGKNARRLKGKKFCHIFTQMLPNIFDIK